MNPKIFFPERGQAWHKAQIVCQSCPVRVECGEFARRRKEEHGVWGGELRDWSRVRIRAS